MTTKPKATPANRIENTVTHSTFTIDGKLNKHSYRAISAVAMAAEANARAIEELARSIRADFSGATCIKIVNGGECGA